MTRSADTIERDVELQREKVQATLNALQDKLSPGQLADQVSQVFTGGGNSAFAQNLGGTVKNNPIPVTLVGLGLAWLMMSDRADSPSADGRDFDAADRWSAPSSDPTTAGEDLTGIRDKAGEALSNLGDKVSGAGDRASELSSRYATRVKRGFFESLDEQPMLLGALGVAVGAALGAALPPTRAEDELIREASDRVKEAAAEIGHEQIEKTRETVKAAAGGKEKKTG